MRITCGVILGLAIGFVTAEPARAAAPAEEASGITRVGDHLLIVADDDPGVYFWYPIGDACHEAKSACVIRINPDSLERVEIGDPQLAADLESVEILADGRVALLSEDGTALFGESGVIAQYGDDLAEVSGRGMEGIAIARGDNGRSHVAALWEGGYVEADAASSTDDTVRHRSVRPVIVMHDIDADASPGRVDPGERKRIELAVPLPTGEEPSAQRFRAPDLVWHEWIDGTNSKSGFIVLLSSEDAAGKKFEHLWLQRFDLEGRLAGRPLDLRALIPGALANANWEGLGWFVPNESLVLVHDKPPKGTPSAVVVPLPDDWRGTPRPELLVIEEAEYYRIGPQQAQPPDGRLGKGEIVELVEDSGSYALVRRPDGDPVYVSTGALRLPRRGAVGESAKSVRIAGGSLSVDWVYSEGPGWIALYLDEGTGSPGTLVGHASLRPGWNANVAVPVQPSTRSKVWGVYFEDRGRVGTFEPASTAAWRGGSMCDSADVPVTLCGDSPLAASRLVDACIRVEVGEADCVDGLPLGVMLVSAVR